MKFKNQNKKEQWALILGGSSGLGLASAKALAKSGINVCIVHRTRRSKMEAFESEKQQMLQYYVEVKDFNMDALDAEKRALVIKFFLDQNVKIKLLLHSIAKGNLKPILSTENNDTLTDKDFALTIDAMAISLYSWTTALIHADLFSPTAKILSFTSMGSKRPLPSYAAVSAAKAALEAITRSLAYELAPLGIAANCIQAGVTDTESLRMIPGSERIKEEALRNHPNRRLTLAEDVANMVCLLMKPEANWITGTIIPVDGGEHLS